MIFFENRSNVCTHRKKLYLNLVFAKAIALLAWNCGAPGADDSGTALFLISLAGSGSSDTSNSGSGGSSESIPTFQVNQISGFSLDGDASDFVAASGGSGLANTILGTDNSGDSSAESGTDIIGVHMGHDGTNLVFFYETSSLPSVNPGSQDINGRWYQLNISGWLIGVQNDAGTAKRFTARDFFGSSGCNTSSTADARLVNNSPAGRYGFEVRVAPSCLDQGSSGQIRTTDQSGSSLTATGDFSSINHDVLSVADQRVLWDFASY